MKQRDHGRMAVILLVAVSVWAVPIAAQEAPGADPSTQPGTAAGVAGCIPESKCQGAGKVGQ